MGSKDVEIIIVIVGHNMRYASIWEIETKCACMRKQLLFVIPLINPVSSVGLLISFRSENYQPYKIHSTYTKCP